MKNSDIKKVEFKKEEFGLQRFMNRNILEKDNQRLVREKNMLIERAYDLKAEIEVLRMRIIQQNEVVMHVIGRGITEIDLKDVARTVEAHEMNVTSAGEEVYIFEVKRKGVDDVQED